VVGERFWKRTTTYDYQARKVIIEVERAKGQKAGKRSKSRWGLSSMTRNGFL